MAVSTKAEDQAGVIVGFPPFIPQGAKVLILGSMPSEASLQEGFYYAHPRNRFFQLLAAFTGRFFDDLKAKKQALTDCNIALFDVIGSCKRKGSLDSAIEDPIPNDISKLLKSTPSLTMVVTNGALAKKLLLKQEIPAHIKLKHLPSTSPANASWSFAKLKTVYFEVFEYAKNHV